MANLDIVISARNEASAAIRDVRSSLSGLNQSASQSTGVLGGLGKALNTGLVTAAGAAVAALGTVGAAALSVAAEFDDAQDTLIAATGASGQALEDMAQGVRDLKTSAAGLDRTYIEIAAVMGEVNTRTGASGEALNNFSEQVLKMTRITGTDGVAAVREITRVMGDWAVPIEGSSLLMDKLFGAGQSFGIGLESLAGKLVQFGAPLRQMGFSLDESIAMLGKWEKEGVNTELVMGSLRIAAGQFARAQGEANGEVVGGVKSMAEAQTQLDKLRQKLHIAQVQQSEFNERTKESSRLSKQMQIDEMTQQIEELESAMALGEFRTISSTSVNKSLAESLRETFHAIKNASNETEALNIGMETFGARAGPDMTAAIREGRFELNDAIAAMNGMAGSIDDVTESQFGLEERWQIGMARVRDSLIPVGNELRELGISAMPYVEEAAGKLAQFLSTTLPGAIGEVREAWAEDWMGIRTTAEETGQGLEIEWIKMRLQTALLIQEMERQFSEADITIDWTGIRIPVNEQDEFVMTWQEVLDATLGAASRWGIEMLGSIGDSLGYWRGTIQFFGGLIRSDWEDAGEGWKLAVDSALDLLLNTLEVFAPNVADTLKLAAQGATSAIKDEFLEFVGWFSQYIISPVQRSIDAWHAFITGDNSSQPYGTGRRFDPAAIPDPTGYVPGFAMGTSYAPGGLALVGERGPELVNLPRGAQVYTARETRQMLASGSAAPTSGGQNYQITINQYNTVRDEIDIAALTERILSELRRRSEMQAWQPTF